MPFAGEESRRMKTTSNYREYAEECRALARKAPNDEHRTQLLNLAEAWEQRASDQGSSGNVKEAS